MDSNPHRPADRVPSKAERTPGWVAILPFFVFLLLALHFLLLPDQPDLPVEPSPGFDLSAIQVGPPRKSLDHPPQVNLGGFERDCLDCHLLFKTVKESPFPLFQHREIVLEHGLNDTCLNCHDRRNRNLLLSAAGDPVPFDRAENLCARCHGTTFRDWRKGIHGRTDGAWDKEKGTPVRLRCTQCHDPHRPRYSSFSPLPGPRTLRMGDPPRPIHDSPLMQGHEDAHGGGTGKSMKKNKKEKP
ncbi:MAG: hypothetical protein ACYTHM_04660 [Planctomycetota bacterium]